MAAIFSNHTGGLALSILLALSMPSRAETVFPFHARATGTGQIGDTLESPSQQDCEKACLTSTSCAAYIYDATYLACTLHNGFADNMTPVDPYDGVALLSGVWVRRDVDRAKIAVDRQADLAFLGPEAIDIAKKQLGELPDVDGESFDAIFDAPDLQDVPTLFGRFDMDDVGEQMARSALHNCLGALKKTRSSRDWRMALDAMAVAADFMTEIGSADQKATIYEVYDALLPTAVNAYLLAVDDFERANVLSSMSGILFQLDRPTESRAALDLRTSFWKDGGEAEMIDYLQDPEKTADALTLADVADL